MNDRTAQNRQVVDARVIDFIDAILEPTTQPTARQRPVADTSARSTTVQHDLFAGGYDAAA